MSHSSKYPIKVLNKHLFLDTCRSLGYTVITVEGVLQVKQFEQASIEAVAAVRIPGWRYDIALTAEGDLVYDNWGAEQGTMETLGSTIQEYNERALMGEIPMHELDNFYVEEVEGGKELVLEWE